MTPMFYLVAIPAVIILGLSKGGFTGLGNLAVPLMSLVMPPVEAAAVILPILVVQDAVSVLTYRRNWDAWNLKVLLPGAFVGVASGYLLAASVSDAAIALFVGLVSIAFGVRRLIVERVGHDLVVPRPRAILGLICGAGSGFTSMIAHAGGPPFQIFVIPQRLPRDVFVGTGVLFFALVNGTKVLPYFLLGQFSRENLLLSATLVPVAVASTWLGIRLVRRVPAERFYGLVYALMIAIGAKLTWDGLAAIL